MPLFIKINRQQHLNVKRHAVADSFNVVSYNLENVEKGSICIDIGASIGGISVPLWSKAKHDGKVITVEAEPKKRLDRKKIGA